MNVKKGLICLLILTMLMLCMPNVTAAPTSKLAAVNHNGYATDVKSKQQTVFDITLAYPVGNGRYLTKPAITTDVNQPVCLWGFLGPADKSKVIADAPINMQRSLDGNTWTTVFTTATNNVGAIDVQITPYSGGNFYYRNITPPYSGSDVYYRNITPRSSLVDVQTTPSPTGVFYYRYTYDGNSQYAPCVSNVTILTVVYNA